MSFVILFSVVESDEKGVHDNFDVENRAERNNEQSREDAIHDHHETILQLQKEITGSGASEEEDEGNEWEHQDVDGEECESDTTDVLIKCNTILKLDNVESPVGIEISPDLLVFVDEHGGQE